MRASIAIVTALPRELSGLVKGWSRSRVTKGVDLYRNGNAVAACAGMGSARVAMAVEAVFAEGGADMLISAGFAGACDPALKAGDLVRTRGIVDTRTGERVGPGGGAILLASAGDVASAGEKQRLWMAYGASAVDMESATVARMAEMRGSGFEAVKAISDEAGFELGEMSRFTTRDGQIREAAFGLHMLSRPSRWGKLLHLVQNSSAAQETLTRALVARWNEERRNG